MAFGRPVFREIGGSLDSVYKTSLLTSREVVFDVKPQDKEKIQEWWEINKSIMKAVFRINYRDNIFKKNPDNNMDDFEEAWKITWKNMLNYRVDGTSMEEVLSENNIDFSFLISKNTNLILLISPFILVFEAIMITLLVEFLNGTIQLVTIIQISLLINFIIVIYIYAHHIYRLYDFSLDLNPNNILPKEISLQFSEEIRKFKDEKICPQKITVNKKYYSYIVTNFIRWASVFILYNTLIFCLSASITAIIGFAFFKIDKIVLIPWIYQFILGAVSIGIGFIICAYGFFWLLLHLRSIAAPLVSAAILGFFPYLLKFFSTGTFDFSDMSTTYLTIIMGLTGLIPTTVAELIKKDVAGED